MLQVANVRWWLSCHLRGSSLCWQKLWTTHCRALEQFWVLQNQTPLVSWCLKLCCHFWLCIYMWSSIYRRKKMLSVRGQRGSTRKASSDLLRQSLASSPIMVPQWCLSFTRIDPLKELMQTDSRGKSRKHQWENMMRQPGISGNERVCVHEVSSVSKGKSLYWGLPVTLQGRGGARLSYTISISHWWKDGEERKRPLILQCLWLLKNRNCAIETRKNPQTDKGQW